MPSLDRRRFIELGTTATAAAFAGCWGTSQSPTYTDWIPAAGESTLTAYLDLTVSRRTSKIDPVMPMFLPSSDDTSPSQFTPDLPAADEVDEPLLALPLRTGGALIAVSGLSLVVAGLGYLIDLEAPADGVTELFLANGTTIGTGEIDVARADDALRRGREGAFGDIAHEVVDEAGEFTIYEPTSDADAAVALSDAAVVVSDARSNVRTAIETWRGDRSRAVDDDETFEWVSNTAGSGDLLVGWVGPVELADYYWGSENPDPATDVVTQQASVLSSLTFAPESKEVRTDLALQSDDVPALSQSQLETQFELSGDRSSITIDGDRVSATTTFTEDDLDIDFVQPTETPTPTPVQSGADVPEEVANAVPDGAFEFTYKEAQGTVRVDFVKEVTADEVTVRAVETESETSTETPAVVSYLTVYVASGGDEVVVTATVDGVTGEVAREDVS